MAASAGTSVEKAVLYKGSQILPFLLSYPIRLRTESLFPFLLFDMYFSVFDMFDRTAQA
jgi:hypothetical protein